MHLLRQWWTNPVDYGWAVDYHLSHAALRFTRRAIGFWCWMFTAVAVFALFADAGPAEGAPRAVVITLIVSAIVVGFAWIFGSWPGRRLSIWFVVYADVGVTAVFASMHEPLVTFTGIALLAVIGSYIATFHDAKVFVGHQVFSLVVTAALFMRLVTTPGTDVPLALMFLTIVSLLQFSVPVLTQGLLLLLRQEATGALFDPLTGLRNRRGLGTALEQHFTGTTFHAHEPFVVLVVDLDDFKSVNDRFGHSRGDEVLTTTAAQLDDIFGGSSVACRSGGEEFTILMRAPVPLAADVAHRCCRGVLDATGVSLSVGVAAHTCDPGCNHHTSIDSEFTELLERADIAMYAAKRQGGNTVVVDGTEHEPMEPRLR
ncbi:MAG: GGDEF domain-containing protein [Rhodococcus sp. (in: high G+C Gram-positive bacteria)]